MGRLRTLLATALLLGKALQAQEREIELEHLVSLAAERSPRLVTLRLSSEAEALRATSEGVLPEPVLQFGLRNVGWRELSVGKEMMSGLTVSLSQSIPFPGKLGLRRSMAHNGAAQSAQGLAAARRALARQVKELYAALYAGTRALELLHREQSTLQDARSYVETRYEVGKSPQADLFKAELQIYKTQEMILDMEEKVQSTRIRLGALLDLPLDSLLGNPREIQITGFPYGLSELRARALQESPVLAQARLMTEQGSLALRMARKELLPDFMIQAGKDFKGPFKDMYEVMLGVEVPLYFWKKQVPLLHVAQLELESSQMNLRGMEIEIETMLNENYLMAKSAERHIALYRDRIIPQAKLSLQASLAGYRAGQIDFLTVLSDVTDLYTYQIEYAQTLATLWTAAARLEELTGMDFLRGGGGR